MTDRPLDVADHAENSPSSAEGWMTCDDYLNANAGLPDDTSWEAAEGIAAHNIRDDCFKNGVDAEEYIGREQTIAGHKFVWNEDDAWLLQMGIDRMRGFDGDFYGEQWVDGTEWLGLDSQGRRQGGTLDSALICYSQNLVIIGDEKWGRGVPVRAIRNKQVMLYALFLWWNIVRHVAPHITDFLIIIDQPRHAGGGGEWRTTLDELLAFGEEVRAAVQRNRAPNPTRTASLYGCLWCRRKDAPGGCGTLDAYIIIELLGLGFEALDNREIRMPEYMTPERRAVVIQHAKMIEDWLDRQGKNCLTDALAGEPTGGLKAVAGNKDADRWEDEKGAATQTIQPILGDDCFRKKLGTPKQIAAQIDPETPEWFILVEPLIKRGGRKPILVPEDDARPPLTTAAEFEDLD